MRIMKQIMPVGKEAHIQVSGCQPPIMVCVVRRPAILVVYFIGQGDGAKHAAPLINPFKHFYWNGWTVPGQEVDLWFARGFEADLMSKFRVLCPTSGDFHEHVCAIACLD